MGLNPFILAMSEELFALNQMNTTVGIKHFREEEYIGLFLGKEDKAEEVANWGFFWSAEGVAWGWSGLHKHATVNGFVDYKNCYMVQSASLYTKTLATHQFNSFLVILLLIN